MLFLPKIFSSDTTGPIGSKFGMNVPWGILHRNGVGNFDLSKNMAVITKIEHRGQTVDFFNISPKSFGLAEF